MKQIGRRDFIKYSTGSIALLALGKFVGVPLVTKPVQARISDGQGTVADPSNRFTLVIDVGACIGCRTCQLACKAENNIPDTISPPWIEVFEVKTGQSVTGEPSPEDIKNGTTTSYTKSPLEGRWYLPVACNHCDNPPCVKVCPVGATYKDKDGIVLIDYDKCIGCRFCVVACPYSARRFNLFKPEVPGDKVNPLVPVRPLGVVEKCTFCVHRTRRGVLPRCVEVCPVRARHFGNLNDPESEVSRLLNSNQHFSLLGELNTGPNLRYIVRGKKWL
ncbi:MAG: 4Fe-4S dicluster domain-containing protein [Dehalococcoidales bacterium]|nr:4Fe-4S dicluster domain-containing protein [Dehalococcoidales bacterium]